MTNTNTPSLAELKRIAEAATPGPLEDIHPNADDGDIRVQVYHAHKRTVVHSDDTIAWKLNENNARFIAFLNPQTAGRLIQALVDARAALRDMINLSAKYTEYFEAVSAGEYDKNRRPAPLRDYEQMMVDQWADKGSKAMTTSAKLESSFDWTGV